MREGLSKKFKRKVVMGILLIFSLGEIFQATEAIAKGKEKDPLGEIGHFNAIVFGNHNAYRADIEGALAVKGDLVAPANAEYSYDIVAAAVKPVPPNIIGSPYNENGMPSLLLGGNLSKVGSKNLGIWADTVVHKSGADKSNLVEKAGRTPKIESEKAIYDKFDEFKLATDRFSSITGSLEIDKKLYPDDDKVRYLNVGWEKSGKNILFSKLEGERLNFSEGGIKEIIIPKEIDTADYQIIYSDAKEVNFDTAQMYYKENTQAGLVNTSLPNNSILHELAKKVVFVFPNATNVYLKGTGIVGSIIAPKATVDADGGSLNGQLITNNLEQKGGFECHNFQFSVDKVNSLFNYGAVEFKKVSDKGEALEGVIFELFDENNKLLNEYKSNKDGTIKVENLSPGKYYFKEKQALEGYEGDLDKKYYFTVEDGKVATIEGGKIVNNKILGSVLLEKIDDEDKTKLNGAEFELYKGESPNGTLVKNYVTSGGQIAIKDLELGKYYFKEVKAPEGYEINGDGIYPFELKDKVEIKLTASNKRIKNKAEVMLVKSDATTKERLKDVEFELYKEDKTTLVDTYKTNDNGEIKITDLEEGKYFFKEKTPLQGYEPNEKWYEVTVNKGTTETVVIEVVNHKKKGGFKINKVDSATNKLLDGAVFELYEEDKNKLVKTIEVKNGEVDVKDLELGTYYLKEVKSPDGYEINSEFIRVVVTEKSLELEKVVIGNKEKLYSVGFKKVDSIDKNLKLEGAKFKLLKEVDGQYVEQEGEYISNSEGKVNITGLKYGKYKIKEIAAPEGYKLLEGEKEFEIKINSDNKEEIQLGDIVNTKLFNVKFTKVDSKDTTKVLEGAKFKIYKKVGQAYEPLNQEYRSNKDGIIEIKGLELGEYKLEEIVAPNGYQVLKDPINFTINGSEDSTKVLDLGQIKNSKKVGGLEVLKLEEGNEKPLAGAEFKLENKDGVIGTKITGEDGRARFENLELGKYTLTETKAPEGYELNSTPIEVEITESSDGISVIQAVYNKKILGNFEIIKVDEEDANITLEGAVFELFNADGEKVKEGVTDKNGKLKFENLELGYYTLKEIKAPEGYITLGNSISIRVEAENSSEVAVYKIKNKKEIVPPTPELKLGSLEVIKLEEGSEKVLAGAEFKLENKDGVIGTKTTGEDGKIKFENLELGKYTLTETKAPEGYELNSNPIEVEITEANVTDIKVVKVNNKKVVPPTPEPKLGHLEIIKYEEGSEKVLEGAKFELRSINGQLIDTKVTNKEGKVKFENLPLGKYTLTELEAPNGYTILESCIEVEIIEADLNKIKTVKVENKKNEEEPPVKPEEPTDPPTEPEGPEEPPVKPEEPTDPPTEPEGPEEPPVKPEEPTDPPTEPEGPEEPPVKPEEPTDPPTEPEVPEEPSVKPEEPTNPPTGPEAPENPSVKPDEPVKPITKPEKPAKPVEKPIKEEVDKLPETGRGGSSILYGVLLTIAGLSVVTNNKKR